MPNSSTSLPCGANRSGSASGDWASPAMRSARPTTPTVTAATAAPCPASRSDVPTPEPRCRRKWARLRTGVATAWLRPTPTASPLWRTTRPARMTRAAGTTGRGPKVREHRGDNECLIECWWIANTSHTLFLVLVAFRVHVYLPTT